MGMFILALATLLLSREVSVTMAAGLLAIVGLMIIMPDVLLAAYPSDILSRKLSATGMGFLTTFTSIAGIITTPLSGKIIDLFDSYAAVFFSFAVVALAGALLTLCIQENNICAGRQR
jgi:sugar phosphate permease